MYQLNYPYTVPTTPMYATVHSVTNISAVVDWSMPANPNGVIEGYRLYFLHGNYTDVKTIKSRDPRVDYVLTDLSPATQYYVWIKAFTWKTEGVSSSRLSIRTDVGLPREPSITNISCSIDNTITIQWDNTNKDGDYLVRITEENTISLNTVTENTIRLNGSQDEDYIQVSIMSVHVNNNNL